LSSAIREARIAFGNDLTGLVTGWGGVVVKVLCVHAVPCVGAVRILFWGT